MNYYFYLEGKTMKKLFATVSCLAMLSVASIGHTASETKIVFPEGSYCGTYEGDIGKSKTFSLYLLKGNSLSISPMPEASIVVKDPSKKIITGRWLNDSDETYFINRIKKTGKHYITIKPSESYIEVKFCAE